jgi:hypothetical protein
MFTHVDKIKFVIKKNKMIWIRFFFHNEKRQCEDLLHKDIHISAYTYCKKLPWNNIKSNYDQMPK